MPSRRSGDLAFAFRRIATILRSPGRPAVGALQRQRDDEARTVADGIATAALLTEAGVMNSPVQDHGDFMAHPHTREVEALAYVAHEGVGEVPMPHIPGLPPQGCSPR